jgi:hypothetical protein
VPISDLHVGDSNFNYKKFIGYRDWIITTPNAFTIWNGDLGNIALKDSKSDVYLDVLNPAQQLERLEELLKPLAPLTLSATDGNHEWRIKRSCGLDITQMLCRNLGVPYNGSEAFLKLSFGSKPKNGKPVVYVLYHTHGFSNGRTKGAKVNGLDALTKIVEADVYVGSHVHFEDAHKDCIFLPDLHNNNLIPTKRVFCTSGAYLDRGGYSVEKCYPPPVIGSPRLRLDATKKDCHCSI